MNNSYFNYLTKHHNPIISPLFSSIPSPEITEQLLNNYFPEGYIEKKIEEEKDDVEEVILSLLHFIQTNSSSIIIISADSGELLSEIPLTPENLEKKWEELFPSFSPEITFCA